MLISFVSHIRPCGEWVTYLDRCANCQDEEASVECYCRPRFFSPIDK